VGDGHQVKIAVSVNVTAVDARRQQLDVDAAGPKPRAVVQQEAGTATGAQIAVQIEVAAPGNDHIDTAVAAAIPIAHKSRRGEPAGAPSAAERLAADGVHPVHAGKAGLPARRRLVPEEHDVAEVRAVVEAGEQVLVAVAVPVTELDRHPCPVAAGVSRGHEHLPVRGESAAFQKPVLAGLGIQVFMAVDERLDAALEEIEVAVAVEIGQVAELGRADLATAVFLAEPVPIADQARIAIRPAAPGLDGVKVDRVLKVVLIRHHENQIDLVHPVVLVDSAGQQVLLISGSAGIVDEGLSRRFVGHYLDGVFVERSGPAGAGQPLTKVDSRRSRRGVRSGGRASRIDAQQDAEPVGGTPLVVDGRRGASSDDA